MDAARWSVPEAGMYVLLAEALQQLESAARVLGNIKAVAPDPERAAHLGSIRSAIVELRTVVPETLERGHQK